MTMVIDLAVMRYANALRTQGWVGDLALVIEQELFGEDSRQVTMRQQYGMQIKRFIVEEHLATQDTTDAFVSAGKSQLLYNLQTLKRPSRGAVPTVAIGRAGQVNVAQQQVNLQRKGGCASPPGEPC